MQLISKLPYCVQRMPRGGLYTRPIFVTTHTHLLWLKQRRGHGGQRKKEREERIQSQGQRMQRQRKNQGRGQRIQGLGQHKLGCEQRMQGKRKPRQGAAHTRLEAGKAGGSPMRNGAVRNAI